MLLCGGRVGGAPRQPNVQHWVGLLLLLPTNVFGRSPVVVSGSLVGVLSIVRPTVSLLTARIVFVARLDPVAVGRGDDVGPAEGARLAPPHPGHEEEPRAHRVEPAALEGDLPDSTLAAAPPGPLAAVAGAPWQTRRPPLSLATTASSRSPGSKARAPSPGRGRPPPAPARLEPESPRGLGERKHGGGVLRPLRAGRRRGGDAALRRLRPGRRTLLGLESEPIGARSGLSPAYRDSHAP